MAEHYCTEHQAVFFKKGKMKGYAHPIKDENGETVGWCNEDADKKLKEEVAKLPPQSPGAPLPEHQEEIDKTRASVSQPATNTMTPEDWAKKNKLERDSIEAQVAFKGMIELMVADRVKLNSSDGFLVMDWARKRLGGKGETETFKTPKEINESNDSNVAEPTGEEVLDEGKRELTLGYVKALVEKNGHHPFQDWIWESMQTLNIPVKGKTARQLWEALDNSQKELLVGGLKIK